MELDHKLIESTEDGDFVFTLNADGWLRKRQQQKNKQQETQNSNKTKHRFNKNDAAMSKFPCLYLSLRLGRGQTRDQ